MEIGGGRRKSGTDELIAPRSRGPSPPGSLWVPGGGGRYRQSVIYSQGIPPAGFLGFGASSGASGVSGAVGVSSGMGVVGRTGRASTVSVPM